MELRWHHWLVALAIATAVHAIVLARVHWTYTQSTPLPREEKMMVAIEAGHEADELAEFTAPPSVIPDSAPVREQAAGEPAPAPLAAPDPVEFEFQPPRPAPRVEPGGPIAGLPPQYADTAPMLSKPADTLVSERPESVAPADEPVTMALLDDAAMEPAADPVLEESVALPEASLPPEVMSEPGPEVANTAALGLGEATDAAALLPSTVLISEQSEAAARTEERVDVDLAAPPETPQATDFATAVTAEAVDLELAPIAPIPEAPPSEPGAVGAIGTPLESGPQPIPELAAVAPRDTVTARAVTPRLRQRDVDIRGVVADYAALLKAWVGRHMSYPVHARLNGVEGTAVVRLVMSRDGRVLSYQLERTSGHVELDQEAIRTIKRASPFPPLPPEMTQIELKLRLPLVFSVKNYEARRTVPPIYLE